MAHCVNRSSPEFKALAEQSNMNPIILAAKVSLWQEKNGLDNFPTIEDVYSSVEVNLSLKAVDILASQKAIDTFAKGQKNNWPIEKTLTELQVPGEQKQLILASGKTNLDDIITDLLANYSYAVEIKTATDPKSNQNYGEDIENGFRRGEFKYFKNYKFEYIKKGFGENDPQIKISREEYEQAFAKQEDKPTDIYGPTGLKLIVPGGTNYRENEIATPAITPSIKGHAQFATDKGIGWFRSDEQFSTPKPTGRFRNEFDENEGYLTIEEYDKQSKTRRILEVQSDLFQKGRDREDLIQRKQEVYSELVKQKDILKNIANIKKYLDRIDTAINNVENDNYESSINDFSYYIKVDTINYKEVFAGNTYDNAPINTSKALEKLKSDKYRYEAQIKESELKLQTLDETLLSTNSSDNQFLQLLNKDNNWVTFFVKSIIQDSAKKGYKKVLFPSGNTASKVEGHTTIEEFKKQKEDRIKQLEKIENEYTLKQKEDGTWDIINSLGRSEGYSFDSKARARDEVEKNVYNAKIEINQLKQELERVEGPEGMGALKPIYNFYETTVKNILNKQGYAPKQVTDEYGNTWNEVEIVPEREQQSILFQLRDERNIEASIKELDNYLLDFMKPFGVRSKEFDELKSRLGVDALGATDVLNKLIWYTRNRNAETIPEEVGHMATMLMGENHPDIKDLLSEVENWSEYKEIYDKYMPIYNNEKQVKIEAIGKLIARSLVKNYKESGFDKTLLQKALDAVTKFINNMLNTINVGDVLQYNSKVADHIALNILVGNKNYIANLKPATEKLNYKKALEGNPFAQKIISFFTGKGMKLTGSIAIAGQGETVYRNSAEPIHDIDFAVNSFNEFEKIQSDLLKMNAEPAHYGWDNKQKDYKTFAFVIPKPGFKINVIDRDFQRGNGWITNYEVLNNKGEVVVPTSQNHLFVDFFVYKNGEVAASNSIFKNFADIYFGKLTLGPLGNNERLFKREKDQTDYVLSSPKSVAVTNEAFRYLQSEEMPGSKVSKETLETLKAVAKQMGIDFQSLEEYAKANPEIDVKGVNGLADLIKGTIAVAQGMENVATTEEIVHIATAILEQTNPKLITQLISKIDRFKIYKQVLATYSKRKEYQLSNGKPDIRKIKKEAVDKLIAELIIYNSEGSTEFPELMEENTRSMIQGWWDTILDFIRGAYSKSNIDIFNIAASNVATGNVGGTVSDIKTTGVFFNIDPDVKKRMDDYVDTVNEHADRIEGPFLETVDANGVVDKRHYIYDGIRVAKSVTEMVKERFKKQFTRTDAEKLIDDQKRDWGSEGHRFIEQYILTNLIDKYGYIRDQFGNTPISSKLSAGLQVKLGEFAQTLINSYPEGTRFLIEKKVVNTRAKGMIASAVDFKAVYPVTKADGTQDFKVDSLDWKFTTVDKSKEDGDLSWFKIREWVPQMAEYTIIDQNYGLRRDQIGKARMVPFILNYENSIPTDKKSPLIPTSIEIGKLDSLKETNMYLLPVPTLAESTGNAQVDALINSLQSHYEKLFKKPGKEENEFARRQQLEQLSRAIRNLHVKLNFEPLYNVAKTFLENAKATISEFEKIDYNDLDEAALKKGLNELLEYQKSANKFASMDDVFLSYYPKAGMTEKNKETLAGLEDITKSTERMQVKILKLMKTYAANLAVKQGIVSEKNKMSVVEAEAQISTWAKTWAEGTKLSAKLVKLASNLLMNATSMVNREAAKQIKSFGELLIPLEQLARQQGKNAFDIIGKMTPSGPELIKKIDKNFLDQVKKAKEDKDKDFLVSVMDMGKFNQLAKDYIEKNLEVLNKTRYSLDDEMDARIREVNKKNLRNSIDINRDSFNGYSDYNFDQIFKKVMIEEGHYSKEYENMAKNEAALNMWKFLTALNEKGIALGYLTKKSTSFLPLIEATTLQKFGQTSDVLGETGDFFKGLYSSRINEEQSMSKIDPETGKVKKVIPKYFTKTDKAVNQLSTDLNKMGTLWIKALLDYEKSLNLEDTLQTLLAVENAKGSLVLDENGSVQFDSSNKPIVQNENRNYTILEAIVDDGLYNLEQDLGSMGNVGISAIAGKFSKTEEGKQKSAVNIKKTLANADTLVRSLGVGLRPLIALANWSGNQFQAYINGGGLYNFWEDYEKNHIKVGVNNLSTIEKGLLDLIVPLNEDVVTEERRKIAKKQGLVNYLSTWSFTDVMMSTNALPEKKLQLTNALSIIDNSMVKNGRIVNIRQYLATQDSKIKYDMSQGERKELEKTYESRVKELKESSSLTKIAKIEGDEVIIPGVSEEELAKFRTQIVEYGRKLNGQMNQDNKAGYRRDAIFTSFMMFKTWIPKLVAERTSDINKNVEVGNWEYGRTRAFIKTWTYLGIRNTMMIRDIINGTDEGLRILDEILQEKRDEHYRKTGQELDITKEEFYDVMRKELTNQMKELKLLVLVMATLMAAKAAQPPEDASDLEKNRYKLWAKALNKISDEITFYYNPLSFEGMTKGSILPSLTLLTKVERVFIQLAKEFGDEPEKAHVGKAIFNLMPGLSQFQTDVWPFIDPKGAKEWGIRVSSASRQP